MEEVPLHLKLICEEGGSSKEYHIHLEAEGGGWIVYGRNGRINGPLTTQRKTPQPVSYLEAIKLFTAIEKEKRTIKHYVDAPDQNNRSASIALSAASQAIDTSMRLSHLNSIELEEVHKLLLDDDWCMEEKQDGEARAIAIPLKSSIMPFTVVAANKEGMMTGLPKCVADDLSHLQDSQFQGELVGDIFHLFDVITYEGKSLINVPYKLRMRIRNSLSVGPSVKIVKTYIGAEKAKAFKEIQERGGEGVVFKNLNAPFVVGRPNKGGNYLKYKFVEEASFITGPSRPGKRSVEFLLNDGTSMGNVTIPPNKEIPELDSIIEVRYLYAHPGGKCIQPVFKGVRTDVSRDACTMEQIKFKTEAAIVKEQKEAILEEDFDLEEAMTV